MQSRSIMVVPIHVVCYPPKRHFQRLHSLHFGPMNVVAQSLQRHFSEERQTLDVYAALTDACVWDVIVNLVW